MNPDLSHIRAVGFDLFETLIRIDWRRLPMVRIEGRPRPSTAPHLTELLREHLPEITAEDLARVMVESWHRVRARARLGDHEEIPSHVRFDLLLERLGLPEHPERAALAREAADLHHGVVRTTVYMPDEERALLEWCAERMPVGLVSNFDHDRSARTLLEELGIAPHLSSVIISASAGKRKPHASLFETMLAELDAAPEHTLFVGDDPKADMDGAAALGITTVWLVRDRKAEPPERSPAAHTEEAAALHSWLRDGLKR